MPIIYLPPPAADLVTSPTLDIAALPPREARLAYLIGERSCRGEPPLASTVSRTIALDKPFLYRCHSRLPSHIANDGYVQSFWRDLETFCTMANLTGRHEIPLQLGDEMNHLESLDASPSGAIFVKARLVSTRCGSLLQSASVLLPVPVVVGAAL